MNTAQRKLLSMAVDLVSYEAQHFDDEMLLTDEFRRITARHPIAGRVLIVGAGLVVTLHLADVLDDRYDLMARKFWARVFSRRDGPNRTDVTGTQNRHGATPLHPA